MAKNFLVSLGKTSLVMVAETDDEALNIAKQFSDDATVEEYAGQDVVPLSSEQIRAVKPIEKADDAAKN